MTIKFSMDRIKNMDQLYTWTPTYSEELGCPGEEEHYHGTDYCKQVIADVFATMNWGTQKYLGSLDRIANEVFNVNSTEGMCTKIKAITHGQQILLAASVGNLVSLSMRSFCQLVVAAIAVGTMNWKSVIDVANWWM